MKVEIAMELYGVYWLITEHGNFTGEAAEKMYITRRWFGI